MLMGSTCPVPPLSPHRFAHVFLNPVLFFLFMTGSGFYAPAAAHDMIPGVSGFPARVLHPFIIIEHFLCLMIAGLIAGAYAGRPVWRSILVLIGGLTVGFAAQAVIPIIEILWMLPLVAAVVAGLLVLAAPRLPFLAWAGVIFALGFAVGLETDPEGVLMIDAARTLGGLVVAGSLLLALVAVPLSRSGLAWVKTMVRILGSWITAIATMVLALNFQ